MESQISTNRLECGDRTKTTWRLLRAGTAVVLLALALIPSGADYTPPGAVAGGLIPVLAGLALVAGRLGLRMLRPSPAQTRRDLAPRRRLLSINAVTVAVIVLSLLIGVVLGTDIATVFAHNLQTKMVYMFFDPETQTVLDGRMQAGGWVPGTPLLQVGDELGLIIKVVPRDGTATGVGGHVDFYVPNGVQVIDAAYLIPGDANPGDGISGYDRVPMKGQSPIAIGDGPIGAKSTTQLIGLSAVGPNVNGVTENPVVPATGLHRGTIAGVYGDTGIFYATNPDTAFGSWTSHTGATDKYCGLVSTLPPGYTGKTITNNSGDVFIPCNKWDAGQMYAWGVKGTTYAGPGAASTPIVDYGDGRGNAPWGFASGVAGPQSGYAWNFDWNEWAASAKTAADMRNAMGNDEIGPWKRIQYPGSRISYDQPGLISSALGLTSVDGSEVGYALSPSNPLPVTVSQTDGTSPKAIRWAVGQLTDLIPEFVWVKIRVDDTAAIVDETGCPVFRGDTFGGDAGGTDNGKDHLWRYYEPSLVSWNGCLALGKPATKDVVKVGDFFQYKVKLYNAGNQTFSNVVVRDTLPNGVQFISAVPAQNSGPNPLVWTNIGAVVGDRDSAFEPGEYFEATVTVKATGSGALDNVVTVDTDTLDVTATDTTTSGNYPLLRQSKSATPTSVAPGGTAQYTIVIDNIGGGPTGSPVTIRDYLEPGITFVSKDSVTVNGASYTATTTVNTNNLLEPVFTVPASIPAGGRLILKFTVRVGTSVEPGAYCNTYTTTQNGIPATTGSLACINVGGGKIGDTIYRDWDGSGTQDAVDEGVEGVTVELYSCTDDTYTSCTLADSTTTDANGHYLFEGLVEGYYQVVVTDTGGELTGYTNTGDPDGGTASQSNLFLADGQQKLNQDFGYNPGGTGSIGDTVWNDSGSGGGTIGDGIQNGTEPGIPNVTVRLYEDTNGNGLVDAGDALVATDVTDGNGNYSFDGLAEGLDYIVVVDSSDPDIASATGTPVGHSTPSSDAVSNLTGTYNDADFGFYAVPPASISGTAFQDEDFSGDFTAGDVVIPNVQVSLYEDLNGNGVVDEGEPVVATTDTDGSGNYSFTDLGPGDYVVVINASDPDVPDGYEPTQNNIAVPLAEGEDVVDIDFPFVKLLTKSVAVVGGGAAGPGSTLEYEILPLYPGPDLLTDVVVRDEIPEGTTYVPGSANAGGEYRSVPDQVEWELGSNTAAVDGIQPGGSLCTIELPLVADTYVREDNATSNFGTNTRIETNPANNHSGNSDRHGLIRFDLSSLPSGSQVQSAILTVVNTSTRTNHLVEVRPATIAWNEGAQNGGACASPTNGATWNDPDCTGGSNGWNGSGGDFDGNSGSTTGTSFPVGTSVGTLDGSVSGAQTITGTALRDQLQSWVDTPSSNHGFVLLASGTDNGQAQWGVKENGNGATLQVTATVSGGCPATGMSIWAPNSDALYRKWTGTQFKASTGALATDPDRYITLAGASSPLNSTKISVGVDNSSDISVQRWDGTNWIYNASINVLENNVSNKNLWGADVAFEQQSGDAVVVWNNRSNNRLAYRVWNGTSWSAAAAIATTITGELFQQVRLAADPNSDEMVVVVGTSTRDLAYVWDGSAWGNSIVLSTSPNQTDVYAAYESLSGDAMVVYGKADANLYYRIWNGASWSAEASLAPPATVTGRAAWTVVASDPNSDRIALGVVTPNSRIWLSVWDGSSWTNTTLATSTGSNVSALNVAVAFEGGSGEALAAYGVSGSNVVRYRTWTSGTGWSAEQNGPDIGAVPYGLFLDPASAASSNADQIMLSTTDNGQDANNVAWSGTSWGAVTEQTTATGGGSSELSQPIIFLYDQNIQLPGAGTTTSLTASPMLVSGSGSTIYVEMTVTAEEAGTVDPDPLTPVTSGGGTGLAVSCTPADQTAQAISAGGSVTFNWTCTVDNAGTLPGSVVFQSTPTGSLTYAQATSNSILTTPPLTYQVTIDSPQTLPEIFNTAQLQLDACNLTTTAPATVCYPVADSDDGVGDNDALSFINPTNGSTTDVGLIFYPGGTTRADHIEAAAWSLDGTTLYVTDRDDGIGSGADLFGVLDTNTATFTPYSGGTCGGRVACASQPLEGSLGSFTVLDIDGLSFDPFTDELYAVHRREGSPNDTDLLLRIDPTTGLHVEDAFGAGIDYVEIDSSSFSLYDIDDISFDPSCGALYATLNTPSTGASAGNYNDRLVIINIFDGSVTDVGRITDTASSIGVQDMEGLSFGTDGVLYGITADGDALANGGSGNPENLWIIDTTTAEATLIGPVAPSGTSYADYESLACQGGSSVQTIPPIDSNEVVTPLPTYSISGTVWYDDNVNQTIDSFPPDGGYIEGAVVLVYEDTNGNGELDLGEPQVGIAFTDANGYYQVDNLPPGDYVIDVYEASITTDESFLASTPDTRAVTLGPDATNQDFGYFEGAYIGDTVFYDKNRNGIYEPLGADGLSGTADDETGLNGVTVTLTGTDAGGNPVNMTYTTGSGTLPVGEYLFLVPPGTYTVTYDYADVAAIDPTLTDQTTDASYIVTVAAGDEFLDADFGVDNSGVVGDLMWNDVNGNGILDAGEPGISNVTVYLCTSTPCTAANAVGTTATDAHGYYAFEGLPDGTYYVAVNTDTLPDPGYDQGVAGFYSLTGDPDEAGLCTTCDNVGTATVTGGGSDLDLDFGYQAPTLLTVSGTVWDDVDGDGVQDAGELGLAGVTVTVEIDSDGDGLVDQAVDVVTDANGDWSYASVFNGSDVTITVDESTLPSNAYVQTGDPDQPGVTCTVCDASYTIDNIAASETDIDFGYQENLGSISGTVVTNADGDGLAEIGETPVDGVTVFLTYAGDDGILGTADDVVTQTTTDSNGDYTFPDLEPGIYQVTKLNPSGYADLADADGGNPNNISVSLGVGEDEVDQDFEVQPTATIGDYVWLDEDGDGVQDAGESGIPNVKVDLYDSTGTVLIASTYADANGGYTFTDVPAGTYTVAVDTTTLPAGLTNATFDEDSGTTGPDGQTVVTVTEPGEEYVTADFGYNWVTPTDSHNPPTGATGAIGDRVWIDADGDGLQDPGEAGLEGVTVNLYSDPDGDGVYDTPVATTTTAPDGSYIFDDVAPGSYVVEVVEPAGYQQTGDPDSTLDNRTTQPIVLAPGDVVVTADFGYQPDDPSVPGNSIGDTVWLDADGDGTPDANEPGIPGVVVELTWYGPDGTLGTADDVIYTTLTDENGEYLFEKLPDGAFDVTVASSNFDPGGALYDSENPTFDADGTGTPNVSTVLLDPTGIDPNPVSTLTQDFGYSPSDGAGNEGVIGDTVFLDLNGNGLPDPGEGIPGVKVTAFDGTNTFTTYTDADGNYTFGDLDPTLSYTISVDPTTLPAGLTPSVDPDGGNDNQSVVDLANDPDGTNDGINLDQDFGYTGPDPLQNSIGDTVWLDADGDGLIDPDEPGIPGVVVELIWYGPDGVLGTPDDVVYTTVTDDNGEFLFENLPDGTFDVTVASSNFDPGGALYDSANPTYDADGIGTPHTSTVSLDPTSADPNPVSNLDQDFGYSPSDGAGNEGVIGDTVFLDLNGNGLPDPGEGIPGVRVDLYTDPDGNPDTDDGVFVGTAYTDANGHYTFGDLDPTLDYRLVVDPTGTTLPAALTNTTDPDGGTPERALVPLSSDPDGVDLDQDFGFAPAASGTIGDTVWLDADRDNVVDPDEPGIPGVTVSLIQDTNGNGVWDAGEPIIATDITDENGHYSFSGLPLNDGDGDADYLVWINDTHNVLGELIPTYDSDGGTLGIAAVALDSASPIDLDQDFAYAPIGHDAGEGLIGDTIFLDTNSGDGNAFNPAVDYPLEGVTVELYDAAGTTLLATTTTDENGHYYFGGLDATGTYTVKVDTASLPNAGVGLTNSVDPDAAFDSTTVVDLAAAGGTSLAEDFGYNATTPSTISGTVWKDTDADGTLEAGETGRYAGVTVVLCDDQGNVVATTTTDADGNYSFEGLPDGTYTVDVTDDDNVLDGTWHSAGTPNTDGQSQSDPYTVAVSGGNTYDADFGYYSAPAALGNFVWDDLDQDGIQDPGEPGIPNVKVTLQITYPSGDVVTVVTVTDADGYYEFGNLLLDESFDGVGTPATPGVGGGDEPYYVISAATPSGYKPTLPNQGNGANDSDDPAGVAATVAQGTLSDVYDFGFSVDTPTAVSLASFTAEVLDAQVIAITWSTASELDNLGFNLYRAESEDGPVTQLNAELIPSQSAGSLAGASYEFVDTSLASNVVTYYYWLEDVDIRGDTTRHGPVVVTRLKVVD